MKKVSDVFKSIRFAKTEPRDKPHLSTDEEGHYTVGEKEFNQQLKHVKKMAMQEEVKDKYDEGEYDREGDMAKSDLRSIIDNAKRLHDMIDDADNLPEWVQSKITLAEDYISTVANYMMSEIDEEVKPSRTEKDWSKEEKQKLDVYLAKRRAENKKNKPTQQMKSVLKKEEVEYLEEKNAPTNPELWSRAKALAKSKFDVYPSAYANGWAAKWYKSKGGGWKTVSEEVEQVDEGLGAVVAKVINKVTAANKTPLPQKSERRQFETPGKPNTPTKTNEEFDDRIIENALGFLKEGRPSQRHPLEGHEYHKKTNAELQHIAKDAHKAAEAMKGHNTQAENKYRDQANDSATVRHFRKTSGMPDWYKKKYGHIKEDVEHIGSLDEAETPPFDPPYKTKSSTVKDKSGAKHTPTSRVKHLAKQAMKKQTEKLKKPRIEEEKEAELSSKTKIVRNALKDGKKKINDNEKTAGGKDKYEANPELSSQIVKT